LLYGISCRIRQKISDGLSSEDKKDLLEKRLSNPRGMTQQEWRSILRPDTFRVAREKGTERPFTSDLYDNHDKGLEAILHTISVFTTTLLCAKM
jgi:hypothetical protein